MIVLWVLEVMDPPVQERGRLLCQLGFPPSLLTAIPELFHPLNVGKQGGVVGLSGGVVCACVGVPVCACVWVSTCIRVGVWVLLCKPAVIIIAYFTFSILMPRHVIIKNVVRPQ